MAKFKVNNVFKAATLILVPSPHDNDYRSIGGGGIGLDCPIPVSLVVEQSGPDGFGWTGLYLELERGDKSGVYLDSNQAESRTFRVKIGGPAKDIYITSFENVPQYLFDLPDVAKIKTELEARGDGLALVRMLSQRRKIQADHEDQVDRDDEFDLRVSPHHPTTPYADALENRVALVPGMTVEQLRKAPCLIAIIAQRQLETYTRCFKAARKVQPVDPPFEISPTYVYVNAFRDRYSGDDWLIFCHSQQYDHEKIKEIRDKLINGREHSYKAFQPWKDLEVALISAAFAETLELVEDAESMFLNMMPSKVYAIEGHPGMFYVAIKQPLGSPYDELLDANNRPDTRCKIFAPKLRRFTREDGSTGHATNEVQFMARFVENHELAPGLDLDEDYEALLLLNETGEDGERGTFVHESLTGGSG